MEIFLIRHGETQANLDPSKPATLTKRGELQVQLVSQKLQDEPVNIIITSDLERALLTATEISTHNNSNHQFSVTKDLREIYRLIVGGAPKEGTRPNRYEEDLERANNMWEELLQLNVERVFVISHGNIMKFFLSKVLNIDPAQTTDINLDPTSITKIEITPTNKTIISQNDMTHAKENYESNTLYAD